MESIKIGDRVIMGNVAGQITDLNNSFFKIKFDTYQLNGESEHEYPNGLIPHLQEIQLVAKKPKVLKSRK